jgi:hypothetical protein
MNILKMSCAITLVCVFGVSARAFQNSKLSRLPPPEDADIASLKCDLKPKCVSLGTTTRICKCHVGDTAFFMIERDRVLLSKWETIPDNATGGGFEVLRGDLDSDQANEIVVANHDSTSNGLGVRYWTISIIPDPQYRSFQLPLTFSVEEYGAWGTFISARGKHTIDLLVTKWEWGHAPTASRKEGLYLVGRWFHYRDGQLVPAANRPVLARRYLSSFERERGQTRDDNPQIPYQWLKSPRTENRRIDPFIDVKEMESHRGTIVEAGSQPDAAGPLEITIRLESGEVKKFIYTSALDEEGNNQINRFGDYDTRSVYPEGYVPSDIQKWLKGRRVSIAFYQDNYQRSRRVLWLRKSQPTPASKN